MKFKSLLAASAVALSVASTAHAADIVVHNTVPVVVVPSFSWTGFYAGAQLGYGWSKDKNDYNYTIPTAVDYLGEGSVSTHQAVDSRGLMGGVYAGFNSDFSNSVVFGVETDFAWSNYHKEFTSHSDKEVLEGAAGSTAYDFSNSTKINWNGATRVRVGYAADRVMPYLAGGVAYTGLRTESNVNEVTPAADASAAPTTNTVASSAADRTMIGWTIGAGVDYAAMDNVILRLEYRYNDYGKKDINSQDLGLKKTLSSNDIRVGVAYKF